MIRPAQPSGAAVARRHLLVINPNTSSAVSALLQKHVQQAVHQQADVRTLSARFGAPYIACEASYAVAAHAVLDTWAAALVPPQPRPDAVLIGCFGDPGLLALRQASAVPVIGLAQAAFLEAAQFGRFAIVTGGERWKPMLERLAHMLGFGDTLLGIETVAPTGAQLAADPLAARALLAQACQAAARRFNAQAVILGGAGLAGMAEGLSSSLGVPLVDSVLAGARQAMISAANAGVSTGPGCFDLHWQGVSKELADLGSPAADAGLPSPRQPRS